MTNPLVLNEEAFHAKLQYKSQYYSCENLLKTYKEAKKRKDDIASSLSVNKDVQLCNEEMNLAEIMRYIVTYMEYSLNEAPVKYRVEVSEQQGGFPLIELYYEGADLQEVLDTVPEYAQHKEALTAYAMENNYELDSPISFAEMMNGFRYRR